MSDMTPPNRAKTTPQRACDLADELRSRGYVVARVVVDGRQITVETTDAATAADGIDLVNMSQ